MTSRYTFSERICSIDNAYTHTNQNTDTFLAFIHLFVRFFSLFFFCLQMNLNKMWLPFQKYLSVRNLKVFYRDCLDCLTGRSSEALFVFKLTVLVL